MRDSMSESKKEDELRNRTKRNHSGIDRRVYLSAVGAITVTPLFASPAAAVLRSSMRSSEESDTSRSSLDRTLRIEGVGERSEYEFTVSGDLQPGPDFDTDGTDNIDGSTGTGRVASTSGDDFYFSGEVIDFQRNGPLRLSIDDEEVDPESLSRPPNTLRITATGESAEYEFTVSGDLRPGPDFDTDGTDSINGSTGAGTIGGTSGDDFYFSGEITAFQRDGPLEASVNGEEVDPDSFSNSLHVLNIKGVSGALIRYVLVVNGDLKKSDSMGATIDDNDTIRGSVARGQVNSGTDSYAFTGEIEAFLTEPPFATVYLDGEEVDSADLGGDVNVLAIERAPESNGAVEYIIETTGQLEKTDESGASVNSNDRIRNGKASGIVVGGSDAYRVVDGIVTDISAFGGEVVTMLNGQRINLAS